MDTKTQTTNENCYHPIPDEWMKYRMIGDEVECPECKISCIIDYDEYWSEELDEICESFFLSPI